MYSYRDRSPSPIARPANPNSEYGKRMLEQEKNSFGLKPYNKADFEPKPLYRKHKEYHDNKGSYKNDFSHGYKSDSKYRKYDDHRSSSDSYRSNRNDNRRRDDHYRKRKSSPSPDRRSSEKQKTNKFDNIEDMLISDPFKELMNEKFTPEAKELADKFCELADLRTAEEAVKVFKLYCDLHLFDKKSGKRLKKIEEHKKIMSEKLKERQEKLSAQKEEKEKEETGTKKEIDLTENDNTSEKNVVAGDESKKQEKISEMAITELMTQIKRINKKLGFCPVSLEFNDIDEFKQEDIDSKVIEEFLQGSKSGGKFRSVATILYNTISVNNPDKFSKCVVYSEFQKKTFFVRIIENFFNNFFSNSLFILKKLENDVFGTMF